MIDYLSIIVTARRSIVWSAALILIVGMLQWAYITVVGGERILTGTVNFASLGKDCLWSTQCTAKATHTTDIGDW